MRVIQGTDDALVVLKGEGRLEATSAYGHKGCHAELGMPNLGMSWEEHTGNRGVTE